MKSKEVIKLLGCTHTSLHNYINNGRLKGVKNDKNGYYDYDDESVYQLYDEICGKRKLNDRIDIFIKNQKYEFILDRETINEVFDFINERMKSK